MPNETNSNPLGVAKVIWMANLSAVMLIGSLIYFLPSLMEISAVNTVHEAMLIIGLVSLAPAFLAGKITGATELLSQVQTSADPKGTQKLLGRFTLAGALAEMPAVFGLVYVAMGGTGLHGLFLAAASMMAIFTLKPE